MTLKRTTEKCNALKIKTITVVLMRTARQSVHLLSFRPRAKKMDGGVESALITRCAVSCWFNLDVNRESKNSHLWFQGKTHAGTTSWWTKAGRRHVLTSQRGCHDCTVQRPKPEHQCYLAMHAIARHAAWK